MPDLRIFAVPPTLIKPFNSDAISIITNLAKLKRSEQDLLGCAGREVNIAFLR